MGQIGNADDVGSTDSTERTASGPLAGVKVLDLSIALTGPYAAALLADQGADVVKVERPGIGDIARWVGVAVNGMSAFYLACNRGKRCIAVDLCTDEGQAIVMQLAAEADVVVQNFRPGVIDRLGLGYEAVRAINPDVVYASISGYGPEGPYRDRSAYDTVDPGLRRVRRQPGRPQRWSAHVPAPERAPTRSAPSSPARPSPPPCSPGPWGEAVSTSRWGWPTPASRSSGRNRPATRCSSTPTASMPSSFNAGFQPMRFLDGWGIVVPTTDADFAGMCKALEVEGWDDPRIRTVAERRQNRDVLEPVMDMCYAMAANLTQAEAIARFERERVAVRHGALRRRDRRRPPRRRRSACSRSSTTRSSAGPGSPATPPASTARRPPSAAPPRRWANTPTRCWPSSASAITWRRSGPPASWPEFRPPSSAATRAGRAPPAGRRARW